MQMIDNKKERYSGQVRAPQEFLKESNTHMQRKTQTLAWYWKLLGECQGSLIEYLVLCVFSTVTSF